MVLACTVYDNAFSARWSDVDLIKKRTDLFKPMRFQTVVSVGVHDKEYDVIYPRVFTLSQ